MLLLSNLFHDGHRIVFPTQDIVEFYNTMMFVKDKKKRSDTLSQFLSILFVNKEKEHQKFISSGMGNLLIPKRKWTVSLLTSLFVLIIPSLGAYSDMTAYAQKVYSIVAESQVQLISNLIASRKNYTQACLETSTFYLNLLLNTSLPTSERFERIQNVTKGLDKLRLCKAVSWTPQKQHDVKTKLLNFWYKKENGQYKYILNSDYMKEVLDICKTCGDDQLTLCERLLNPDEPVTEFLRDGSVNSAKPLVRNIAIDAIIPGYADGPSSFIPEPSSYSSDKDWLNFYAEGAQSTVALANNLIRQLQDTTNSFISSGNLMSIGKNIASKGKERYNDLLFYIPVFTVLLKALYPIIPKHFTHRPGVLFTGILLGLHDLTDFYTAARDFFGSRQSSFEKFYYIFDIAVIAFQFATFITIVNVISEYGETPDVTDLILDHMLNGMLGSFAKFILLLTASFMDTNFKNVYQKIGTEGFNQVLYRFFMTLDYQNTNKGQVYFFYMCFLILLPLRTKIFNVTPDVDITHIQSEIDIHNKNSAVILKLSSSESIQLINGYYQIVDGIVHPITGQNTNPNGAFLYKGFLTGYKKLKPGTYVLKNDKLQLQRTVKVHLEDGHTIIKLESGCYQFVDGILHPINDSDTDDGIFLYKGMLTGFQKLDEDEYRIENNTLVPLKKIIE